MKSFQFKSLLLLAALIISLPSFGQGLKAFKLKNGLSVSLIPQHYYKIFFLST